jgi:phage terminase small subunit
MEKDIPHIDIKKLTPKQKKFCEEYLIDLNATQAAVRAGYSPRTANPQAARLLANVSVKQYIQSKQDKLQAQTEITQEFVLSSLQKVALRSMQAEPVLDRDGNETGAYVFNAAGANKSLELLGKHIGLFTDKIEHSGNISHTINIVNFAKGKQ